MATSRDLSSRSLRRPARTPPKPLARRVDKASGSPGVLVMLMVIDFITQKSRNRVDVGTASEFIGSCAPIPRLSPHLPMGYIPSIRLSDAFEVASTGVYVEELQDQRVGLVCKIPDNAIKALHRGAQCSLFMAVVHAESLPILCLSHRNCPRRPISYR